MASKKLLFVLMWLCIVFAIGACTQQEGKKEDDNSSDVTSCNNPAPLTNKRDNTTFGYIFGLDKSVDVNAEVARLKEKYSIKVHRISERSRYFLAEVDDAVLE